MSGNGYVNARTVLPPQLLARVQRYCSGFVYVPVPEPNRHRDEQIREMYQQGRSVEEIATQTGLSKRRVWQILKRNTQLGT
jgi:DNA invertase Pin-like site-specific DNA recombinase